MHRYILCASIAAIFSSYAFAQTQSGSAGGVIGKQDKSISGNTTSEGTGPAPSQHQAPSPGMRASNSQVSSPRVIHLNEHNILWGDFSATLIKTGSNTYQATWNVGLISKMTVTIGADTMTIEREDLSGSLNLCRGHYSGTRIKGSSQSSGEDTVVCQIGAAASTWRASW